MSEAMLQLAADILGPLVEDVVFVRGATVHLWLTEEAAPPVRATDDVMRSLDVHDIVVLVNGRPELVDELAAQSAELRAYVAEELAALHDHEQFEYVIQDAERGYGDVARDRARIVTDRLELIVERLR